MGTAAADSRRGDGLGSIEVWMANRWSDLQRLGSDAEAAGHEALGWAARTGAHIFAPRPSDVAAVGDQYRRAQDADADQAGLTDVETPQEIERVEPGEGPDHSDPEAMNLGMRFQAARPGDSISRMIGSSDPRAIGKFLSLNGMHGRDSTVRAGRSYLVPTHWDDASDDEARVGQALLRSDNARLRPSADERAAVARQAQLLAEGRNIWIGEPTGARPNSSPTGSLGNAQFATWDAEAARHSPFQRALDRVVAGARGAQDALTLGAGDYVTAGVGAAGDALGGKPLGPAFHDRMARERLRDEYDSQRYPVSRATGQVVGTGVGLLALGPMDAALAGGVRMAEATPLVAREIGVLSGVGAGGGVAAQGVEDFERKKLSPLGDYVGSGLGGAADALASARLGPGQAAALGGTVMSVSQDVLNGRRVDFQKAGRAALAGGYAAAPVGYAGRRYAEALTPQEKGALGERLGILRTRANFDVPIEGPKTREYLRNGTHIYPDQRAVVQRISEQKFGRRARLSPGQRLAKDQYGDDFRIDHFLPRDIGAIYGFVPGQLSDHQFWQDGP